MSNPDLLTSYLNHPQMRKPIPGVLRVLVARRAMGFQSGRFDAHLLSAAPSEDAMQAGRLGNFASYETELADNYPQVWGDFVRLTRDHPTTHTVILMCHEADATTCHRRLTFAALQGRDWYPGDELSSPHGGKGLIRCPHPQVNLFS